MWSEPGEGAELEVTVPAANAYSGNERRSLVITNSCRQGAVAVCTGVSFGSAYQVFGPAHAATRSSSQCPAGTYPCGLNLDFRGSAALTRLVSDTTLKP